MGYKKMSFGCLKVGTSDYLIPVAIPNDPTLDGDIFEFASGYSLHFGPAEHMAAEITWIKPDNMPIFVADRVLVNGISYDQLEREGIAGNESVGGKVICLNGVPFCCRLLDIGAVPIDETPTASNEWNTCLYVAGDENDIWHWSRVGFWGNNTTKKRKPYDWRPFRGFNTPYYWGGISETHVGKDIGFRPVLEPLQSMPSCQYKEITLDAQQFCVVQNKVKHPIQVDFRPALYPQVKHNDGTCRFEGKLFSALSDGQEVKMYTLVMDRKPIRQDKPLNALTKYRAGLKFVLTDKYYGEEYLIPWIIHHGCAFAAKEILRDVPTAELIEQGYLPE